MPRSAARPATPIAPTLRKLTVELPAYLVMEVQRAAKVRSTIEHARVSPAVLVERALRDYLWADEAEMQAGELRLADPPEDDSSDV